MPFAALLLAAQLAFAPDAGPASPRETGGWYGYQIVLADAALIGLAIGTENGTPLLGMLATGPIIHALHDKGRSSIAMSLLRRSAFPVGGLLIGVATCDDDDDASSDEEWGGSAFQCLGAGVGGFLVGAAVAEVVDLAVATEDLPMPIVTYDGQHAMVGFGGRF